MRFWLDMERLTDLRERRRVDVVVADERRVRCCGIEEQEFLRSE